MFSRVNVLNIFTQHFSTIRDDKHKIDFCDKFIFFYLPLLLGILSCYFIGLSKEIINIIAVSLSVFIGLFLNLLMLLISYSEKYSKYWHNKDLIIENEDKPKDLENQRKLTKTLFYNISYTIVLSIVILLILIVAVSDKINDRYLILSSISYSLFYHLLSTLFMVIKRTISLFEKNFTI